MDSNENVFLQRINAMLSSENRTERFQIAVNLVHTFPEKAEIVYNAARKLNDDKLLDRILEVANMRNDSDEGVSKNNGISANKVRRNEPELARGNKQIDESKKYVFQKALIETYDYIWKTQSTNHIKSILKSIGIVKGLYIRVWKQDTDDWITVCKALGISNKTASKKICHELQVLLSSVRKQDEVDIFIARTQLRANSNFNKSVQNFLGWLGVVITNDEYKTPVTGIKLNNKSTVRKRYTNRIYTVYLFIRYAYKTQDTNGSIDSVISALNAAKNSNSIMAFLFGFPSVEICSYYTDSLQQIKKCLREGKANYKTLLKQLLDAGILNCFDMYFKYLDIDTKTLRQEIVKSTDRESSEVKGKTKLEMNEKNAKVNPVLSTKEIVEHHTKDLSERSNAENKRAFVYPKREILWIYHYKLPCQKMNHTTESLTARVMSFRDGLYHEINVICCKDCEKYYLNAESFNLYARRFGLPQVSIQILKSEKESFSGWNEESLLHMAGYNVNAVQGLKAEERRAVLTEVLDTGLMEKYQVTAFLEGLIRRNKYRLKLQNAINKWTDDLHFVNEYQIEKQKVIYGEFKIAERKVGSPRRSNTLSQD